MSKDISVRVFTDRIDAEAEAQVMRDNGFRVPPVSEATDACNWSNSTNPPPVTDDARAPCWVVIDRR